MSFMSGDVLCSDIEVYVDSETETYKSYVA